MANNMNLFIPNVLSHFSENDIRYTLDSYNWGIIQNILFTFDNNVRNAIVYFAHWNSNTQAIRSILQNNDYIKIYYKPNRCWKAFEYIPQYDRMPLYNDDMNSVDSQYSDEQEREYIDIPENPILDYGIVKMPPPIFVRKNGQLTYTKIKINR